MAKKDELEQLTQPTRRYLTAAVAAGVMGLNAQMITWGRTGVSDMLLTGCIASALLCFFLGYSDNEKLTHENPSYLISGTWLVMC